MSQLTDLYDLYHHGRPVPVAGVRQDPLRRGEPGNINNPDAYLRWIAEGAESISQVVADLRVCADSLEAIEREGWVLTSPVTGGVAHVHWPSNEDVPSVA